MAGSSDSSTKPRRRGSPALWTTVAVLLAVPIVLPLAVPLYARETPELGGIPFFFWFQFALIPVAAICTTLAYRAVVSVEGDPDEVQSATHRPDGTERS